MISLPVEVTAVYPSCLLNLENCLLLFINKVTLKTGMGHIRKINLFSFILSSINL